MFSASRMYIDLCNMVLCIAILQHEVMVLYEWHNWPQDLIIIALYIQNATNEMHLCSLSITYTFPYCNPPPPPWVRRSTMFSAHQSSTQQPSYITSTLYNENCNLSVKRTSLQSGRHHMQSGQGREWEHKHADKLLWYFLWQFVQNLFSYANQLWQQLSRWLVSDNLGYEGAECWGHGLVYLHVACLLGIWLFSVCFFSLFFLLPLFPLLLLTII